MRLHECLGFVKKLCLDAWDLFRCLGGARRFIELLYGKDSRAMRGSGFLTMNLKP